MLFTDGLWCFFTDAELGNAVYKHAPRQASEMLIGKAQERAQGGPVPLNELLRWLGWRDTVIVQLTLESHTDETLYDFGRALAEIPEVMEAYLVSGDYDYYIRIAVRDTRDYERLLREKLYRIPGIRHSKSSFVLRVLKDAQVPMV